MLFSEIYGNYYNAVSHILKKAVQGSLDKKSLNRIVCEEAFGESMMIIPDSLQYDWGLLTEDYDTPLNREPSQPLTILEKRWMKAILQDPRIRLFGPDMTGLDEVEPLFRQEWIVYYDRYTDGDPFTDSGYIHNFQCVLSALKENRQLDISFSDGRGYPHHVRLSPKYMEYSEKDDRFRLVGDNGRLITINLSRIDQCSMLEEQAYFSEEVDIKKNTLTLILTDRRNTLERFLLHFSHLEKETKRLDEEHYKVTLRYDRTDETEMLIRILSFGPMVKVISPENFCQKLRQRIERQMQLTEMENDKMENE